MEAICGEAGQGARSDPPCFVAVTLAGMLASGKPAKDARAYLFRGPSTRIAPVITEPGQRPHARSDHHRANRDVRAGST